MPNLTAAEIQAGMVAPEQGEESHALALALIWRALEVVETLPVLGVADLQSPLSKLHIAHSAVAGLPLQTTEAT